MRLVMAALATAMLIGVAHPRPQPATVLIYDVHVLDVEAGAIRHSQAVLVRGDRIAWVGPSSEASDAGVGTRIDGRGRYLLPGLADMHVHITSRDFGVLLANGVTTVRELNGSPEHLTWRARIASGTTLGPALYVSSPLMSGVAQRYRHVLIPSPDSAVAAVRRAAAAGYDFIKAYDGLSLASYQALVAEALRLNKPVVGHIPAAVGIDTVLGAGQRSIEHADQITARVSGHPPDRADIAPAVARIAAHDSVWITPTLAVEKFLSMPGSPWADSLFGRPYFSYAERSMLDWWMTLRRGPPRDSSVARRQAAYYSWKRDLVRALHAAGVRLLVGTDTPNPGMVPGFSLHEELAVLTEAGLSPAEVLRAATAGAAEFVGATGEFGVIQVGARADLVLTASNPLDDLAALRSPAAVMVRGQWLDRAALDGLLRRARE